MNNPYQNPHYRPSAQQGQYQKIAFNHEAQRGLNPQIIPRQQIYQMGQPYPYQKIQNGNISVVQPNNVQVRFISKAQSQPQPDISQMQESSQPISMSFSPALTNKPCTLKGLMSPPVLPQQPRESTTTQQNPTALIQSQQNQQQLREIIWGEEEQINNTFWEQKFFMIYQKFQWFGQRFEIIKADYYQITETLHTVDSQDDWNLLKDKHQIFSEKLEEMFQELISVANQNQMLVQQKLGTDDPEGRYRQLLGNFQALRQQNTRLQQLLHKNPQPNQNIQQLLQHCRSIQEQYQKVTNEYNGLRQQYQNLLNKSQHRPQNDYDFQQIKIQYQNTIKEMENQYNNNYIHYQRNLQDLQNQKEFLSQQLNKVKKQKQIIDIKYQEMDNYIISLTKQANQLNEQCQHYKKQLIQQKKSLLQQHSMSLSQKQNVIQSLKQQLTLQKSKPIQPSINPIQINQLNQKIYYLSLQLNQIKKQNQYLSSQLNEKQINKYQVYSLEKKLKLIQDENQQLNHVLKTKNQQIILLRDVQLKLHTYQNVIEQYKIVDTQKIHLEQSLKKIQTQINTLRRQNNQLQHQNHQVKNYANNLKNQFDSRLRGKQSDQQLVSQRQISYKLQSQLNKFKQIVQSKHQYIGEIQIQNNQLLTRIEHIQVTLDNQRAEYKSNTLMSQKKVQLLERRNKSLEFEFKKQIQQNYQKQIQQLRHENSEKLKKLKRFQQQLNLLKSRSSISLLTPQQNQLSFHKLSILQQNKQQLLSNLELSYKQIKQKDQDILSLKEKEQAFKTQIHSYNVQMEQADLLIRNKNQIINDYQRQVNQFMQKIQYLEKLVDEDKMTNNNKMAKYQSQIQSLKQKLSSTQTLPKNSSNSRISLGSNSHIRANESPRIEMIAKMQQNIIQQLNEDNTKLRTDLLEMTKRLNQLQTVSRIVANMETNKIKESPKKLQSIENIHINNTSSDVQQRLRKFNQRLEVCIQESSSYDSKVNLSSSQRLITLQKQKRQLENLHDHQIKVLYDRIQQLQQQLSSINQSNSSNFMGNMMGNTTKQQGNTSQQLIFQQKQKLVGQQLQCLRINLVQKQVTNSGLLKLNSELKRQLQQMLSSKCQSTSQYYKLQWKQSQWRLSQLSKRHRTLTQEFNKINSKNSINDTKLAKQYQMKLFQLQNKINQLERDNKYLHINRTKGDNQRANLLHDVNVFSADVQALKNSLQSRVTQYQKQNQQLKDKCLALQTQLDNLNQKLRKSSTGFSPSFGSHSYNPKIMV